MSANGDSLPAFFRQFWIFSISSTTIKRRNIVSGAVGNSLEWYDFAVYGTMAPIIGKLFFPSDDPFTSLLAAFGVFAIGYIARPLGVSYLVIWQTKLAVSRH